MRRDRATFEQQRQVFEAAHRGLQAQRDELAERVRALQRRDTELSAELQAAKLQVSTLQVCCLHPFSSSLFALSTCLQV